MAGIYVHIPFCKVKCHYCDFHFSIQLKNLDKLVDAICLEIDLRKDYLNDECINTIYFGGGTPSILESTLIAKILNKIHQQFTVSHTCEVTLECNPDDLSLQKLQELKALGVNRLSIGIQSFDDKTLQFMNRAHSSKEAIASVEMAQNIGIDNLTIDLIYGVPGSSLKTWENELLQMEKLNVPHLSAYCLTIEENTVFGNMRKKGKLTPHSDEDSITQFQFLMDFMESHNYEQYEISNFSKEGFISQHNSAYWRGETYLGIGPSAHSYNRTERGWNIANNPLYIKNLNENKPIYELETLSKENKYNDYILTRLRTKWGIDLSDLKLIFPERVAETEAILVDMIKINQVNRQGDLFILTAEGKYLADALSADLFV